MTKWNKRCRFFDEKYACDTLSSENYQTCRECRFSQEYSKKILILKLGAMGDVLRTTAILPALKKKYGEDIFIYWMTNPESVCLLKNNPMIDKILPYNFENNLRVQQERFDILLALEIDTPSTLLANLIKADQKFGFFFEDGTTSCFNKGSESYLETAFLNHIKRKNRRTYQDLIFEACELPYNKEKPIFNINNQHISFGEKFMLENNLLKTDRLIGINIGSASRWASKFWDIEKIRILIKKLSNHFKIIVLAGVNEVEKQNRLSEEMSKEGIFLIKNNPYNSLDEFAAVVNLCDWIICGDTLALHLAIVLDKKTIALFFSTPPWEIEDCDKVIKLVSPVLEKYFFINQYIQELADSISVEDILKILSNEIQQNK